MVNKIVSVLFTVLIVVAVYHRLQAARSREPIDRRQEGWFLLIGIRLAGLLLLLAGIAAFRRPSEVPEGLQWIGVAVFGLSAALLCWMFVTLGRNLTDTVVTRKAAVLVTNGPYRYIRHPMYTGLLGAGLGLALVQGSWQIAACAVALFTMLAVRSRTEENFLTAKFGTAYIEYMQRVARFCPRVI